MRHLSHAQIDKAKWDALVLRSKAPYIYVISWYLDVACPKWEALVWEKEGRYEAAIPLPTKRFLLFKWVQMPYFVQQTGLIYENGQVPDPFLTYFFKTEVYARYLSFHLPFQSDLCEKVVSLVPRTMSMEFKKNFLLPLSASYAALYGEYNENRRRNLKKASSKGWKCRLHTDIKAAVDMYTTFQQPKQAVKKGAFDGIIRIYEAAEKRGAAALYCCEDAYGTPLAYALFLRFGYKIYYMFGAMSEEGRAYSANSLAFDHVIHQYAEQEYVLDFEGGTKEGIGHYFASFGATSEEYVRISFNWFDRLIGHRK